MSAQQTRREPPLSGGRVIPLDPCAVAPVEQLRFLVAANVARLTQPNRPIGANRIAVRSLSIDGATCAPFRTALHATVTIFMARASATDSIGTAMRFTADWAAQARFRDTLGMRRSATLDSATLCVRGADITGVEPRFGTQIERSRLHALLLDELQRQCFEITSLVYVFLERGGTLTPP